MSEVLLALGLLLLADASAGSAAIGAERAHELERLVRQDCGACHGMTLKGGLGPDIRAEALAHLDRAEVAGVVLDGRPGTAMPPWRPLLTEAEAAWIADYLLDGETE